MTDHNDAQPSLRMRVMLGNGAYVGPGRADLLQGIAETGSIAAAGRRMNMSYRRAWLLIDALHQEFGAPMVTTAIGGKRGGGAQLTELGQAVLQMYRQIVARCESATAGEMRALAALRRNPP
ncbi:MAG: LysR family transcriptional regulator [Anaerolineae bacterium]|jgi:molybdate transport system regulatory protein|nr:LysR family transcriptional regulator [Anaerolineae bacterium]HRD74008.1 LysR family transcriptional regulator [Aquimonas sp.]